MYNVLIVDDEKLTRNFLSTIIPKLSTVWNVIGEASDGSEALMQLQETSCDLIITDIKMPVMDGVTMCKHVSDLYPDIKLIILSGYGEFEYAKKAIRYNVTNYLLKPIVNKDLKDALNSVAIQLNQKLQLDQSLKKYIKLSSNYKDEIITKLLKSIITNDFVQTQTLLNLFYRLNVQLIEEECVVVVVVPSSQMLAQTNYLQNEDISSILIYQTVAECIDTLLYKVFLDADNNTVIYAPIPHETDLSKFLRHLSTKLNCVFNSTTGQSLECYMGSPVSELLQLDISYQGALEKIYPQNLPDTQLANYIFAVKGHVPDNIRHARTELLESLDIQTSDKEQMHFNHYIYSSLKNSIRNDRTYQPSTLAIGAMLDIYEALHLENKKCESEDSLIDDAICYIKSHYAEPISLAIIADHLSISPSYLSNIFHATVGQSYIKYLTSLRLEEACYLLSRDKNMTLNKITKLVGYLSVKHFSYVFKKKYQMTPGQYRRQN